MTRSSNSADTAEGGATNHREAGQAALALVEERFPDEVAILRRLVVRNAGFRGLCEDYALARKCLSTFEARADAIGRPEIADYRVIIAELESEIAMFVLAAARAAD